MNFGLSDDANAALSVVITLVLVASIAALAWTGYTFFWHWLRKRKLARLAEEHERRFPSSSSAHRQVMPAGLSSNYIQRHSAHFYVNDYEDWV